VDERGEWTGEKILKIELSRTYFGGLDETATRELLANVAASVDESARELKRLGSERNELAQRVKELETALEEQVPPEVSPEGYTEQALSQLIHDARQKFDDLLQEANDEAESVKAAAAREAEQMLADSSGDLQATQDAAVELRRLLVDTSNRLAEALETAFRTVEALAVSFQAPAPDDTIVEDLWPTASENAASENGAEADSSQPDDEHEVAEAQAGVSAEPAAENQSR
jgi:cell division septum initiation protein DivIVA